jgi:epoxyqueuosine reductase
MTAGNDKKDVLGGILAEAGRLGFAAAGVAAAAPAQTFGRFEQWLASGRSAGMAYLSRHGELRADPRKLAPGARSVVVVAARYPANPSPEGGFSTYARGEDYHDVIRRKLKELSSFIGGHAKLTVARVCVDSAPLLEREWAVRAGIGWIGRQGQVVSPAAGCCILLGCLLVDLDLPESARVPAQCGACRRCEDACPTRAVQDGLVDARRCISYLTIEHAGEIDSALEGEMGVSLFGCDRCTAVCPWNAVGEDKVMPEFAARAMPDAEECRTMSDEAFRARFTGTAVLRSGAERLRRNASIACARRT